MKVTNSEIITLDVVDLNHRTKIEQFLSNNGIELCGNTGCYHQVESAYSSHPHDCSILDSSMFGIFQSQIDDNILIHMSKIIPSNIKTRSLHEYRK